MAEKTDKSSSGSNASVLERLSAVETSLARIVSILEGRGGISSSTVPEQSANISQADWDSLGTKLDEFEKTLGEKEKAVLLMVLGAAAATYDRAGLRESPALGGVNSTIKISGSLSQVRLSDGLKSIGSFTNTQVGSFGGGAGPVSDSIGVGGDFTCVHGDWSKDLGKGAAFDDAMIRGRWNALGSVADLGATAKGGFGVSTGAGGFG
ncbi:hypothetical protein VVT58_19950 (plasmid) [Sphingobium sp. SJ10-10]|uniref:hypothetical protein n=1 Tax=Sphingobium sp. SJ10-10 TaxID=3114999 RepID=UPI002E18B53C|nr:hypothetical protein [Sphingobium sp. SJ10-10]